MTHNDIASLRRELTSFRHRMAQTDKDCLKLSTLLDRAETRERDAERDAARAETAAIVEAREKADG